MRIPGTCIEIHTMKFPILDGEEDEVVNEGMYGKALCQYLEREMPRVGLEVPLFLAEDWGWWIEVKENDFVLGLQIYSDSEAGENPEKYAIMSSISKSSKWQWKKFRKIDLTNQITEIMNKIYQVLSEDPEILVVKRHDDFPF
jgi:hypothetical protein